MRRFLTPLLAASLAIGATVASNAITLPSAVVTLGDGESFTFTFVPNANGFALSNTSYTFMDGATPADNSVVTLGSIINTGASSATSFVTYSFGVTNNAGPQTYDLTIGSGAIVPKAAGSLAQATFVETGFDNTGFGGTVSPTGSQTTLLQVSGDSGDLDLSLGAPTTFPPGNAGDEIPSQGPLKATNSLLAPISSLGLHLGISVPGGGNTYNFTGRISVSAVPEPGALTLIAGLAVSGAYGLLRRRRK